jgi:hypothetical protein
VGLDDPEEWHVAGAAAGAEGAGADSDEEDLEDFWDEPASPAGMPAQAGQFGGGRFGGGRFGGDRRGAGWLRGHPGWLTAAVAFVAAAIGIAVGLAFLRVPSSAAAASPAATASPAAPSAIAPATGGSGGGNGGLSALPPLSGNGSGDLQMTLMGTVLAISDRSITIGGAGPLVTAAITSATKFTGSVTQASGIKVGAEVAAEITGTGATLSVTHIEDPA